MNREYFINFIKFFIENDFNEITITLKNGSTILIDSDIENIEYGHTTITITDLFNENSFIQFSYNFIKEIKINGNEEE